MTVTDGELAAQPDFEFVDVFLCTPIMLGCSKCRYKRRTVNPELQIRGRGGLDGTIFII